MKAWVRDLLLRLLANTIGLYAIVIFLGKPAVELSSFQAAVFVVGIWSVLLAAVRPIIFAVKLATSPLNFVTIGLSSLILGFLINVIVTASVGVAGAIDGFKVKDLWTALKLSVLYALINAGTNAFIGGKKDK